MKPMHFTSSVQEAIRVNSSVYRVRLRVPEQFRAQPGQFVHVRVVDAYDPLLRRPLSIYRAENSAIELLYEVKGRGTALLSQKARGETVNILGPLGNGFSIPKKIKRHILVAGGIGVAPLMLLTQTLRAKKYSVIVALGALTKSKLLCVQEFKKLGCEVLVSTDDGSSGLEGRVTELFSKKILQSLHHEKIAVYACGPYAMLANLAKICHDDKVSLQVSLEEFMGCGIGACLGCVIKTKTGYQRICHDGPVFSAEDIVWNRGGAI